MLEEIEKATSVDALLSTMLAGRFTRNGTDLIVTGSFYCRQEDLVSLKGAPRRVGGSFNCQNNQLTSLEGAATLIGAHFSCIDNKLTSLKDVHKHIHMIRGNFYCTRNPIKSHVLGLLKIKGLHCVLIDDNKVEDIINKYLPEGDIFACQQELIDAGLEEYAQL